ncbi:MAG: PLP-dependent aminotransferase family protein [Gammaproteobacteria bacterium]|nr:PLP-dependent aminotransferase family protein [Gammaproteobacteria bacterium]
MQELFSDRISDVPPSFIREILKVTQDPTVISFAGGLPSAALFPTKAIQAATQKVFETGGNEILQYSTTEGYGPLREYIATRYRDKMGLEVNPDNILITNGSQQGLDLLGKALLNEGDEVIIEAPGYLGAIQAFSIYRARFHAVPMDDAGMQVTPLQSTLATARAKLMYTVPNFQNPSGISYTNARRREVVEAMQDSRTLLIEDDPYGDIRFEGTRPDSFASMMPERTILLGSFSKTVVPSFRLGWIVAPDSILEKLVIAKQASDLHTNYFSQRVLYQYLCDNDLDAHIENIIDKYGRQRDTMLEAIGREFPDGIETTHPDGGMFLWVRLPEGYAARDLLQKAIKDKVVFVPGDPFYVDGLAHNSLRLSFSTVDEATIAEGIKRLALAIRELLQEGRAA